MINLNLPAFYLGVREELEKLSSSSDAYDGVYYDKYTGKTQAYPTDGLMAHLKRNKGAYLGTLAGPAGTLAGTAMAISMMPDDNPLLWSTTARLALLAALSGNRIGEHFDSLAEKEYIKKHKSSKVVKEKKAGVDVSGMPINENILPTMSSQAKWRYVRTKDGLKLTDGNLVYSFGGFPEDYPAEDTRISRLADDNILNFENDALSKGTAQIHRSSPDNIYMTLATGKDNPTFMLQHEGGQNWRYNPSKKFLAKLQKMKESLPAGSSEEIPVDASAVLDAAKDTPVKAAELDITNPYIPRGFYDADSLANLFSSSVRGAGDFVKNTINTMAERPVTSAVKAYALGLGIDKARDFLDPEREESRKNLTNIQKAKQYINPVLWATLPVIAAKALKAE
jgi:hypothetical protein